MAGSQLKITAVRPGGLAAAENDKIREESNSADKQLCEGDILEAVNGQRGVQAMTEAIASSQSLLIEVHRGVKITF